MTLRHLGRMRVHAKLRKAQATMRATLTPHPYSNSNTIQSPPNNANTMRDSNTSVQNACNSSESVKTTGSRSYLVETQKSTMLQTQLRLMRFKKLESKRTFAKLASKRTVQKANAIAWGSHEIGAAHANLQHTSGTAILPKFLEAHHPGHSNFLQNRCKNR